MGMRCQIGALKESGLSNGAVAARPGRDRPSVWRELRRNGGDSGYSPGEGRGKAEVRRSGASSVPRRMTAERRAGVDGLLEEGWSPERIAGRLWLEGGWAVGRQWTSGYPRPTGRRAAGCSRCCAAAAENRTGGAGGTRAGATSRAGWTSPGGLR